MTDPHAAPAARPAPDDADEKDDDWPSPEAREAAKRHRAADDDNPLESIGKAISSPVLDTDAADRKP